MQNKVVIITGASSGIGKACAEAFAMQGARVILAARNVEMLSAVATAIINKGGKAAVIQADISIESDCRRMVEETVRMYGSVDILINNAGISMRAVFETLDLSVIRRIMDVNFWGAVYCTKHALPYLLQRKGSVVGISSIAGKKGLPGRIGYSASKFALEGFLETLRTENLKQGLHVLVVCPGFTQSNIRNTALMADGSVQKESPRNEANMMTSAEVAAHIVKAVAQRKRDLVLTAQGKLTVWLNKFFPAFLDKVVYNHMKKEPDSPLK